jgi:hypothetical protein
MIRAGRLRERFRRPFLKQGRDRAPLCLHVREAQLVGAGARNHNEIHAFGQQIRGAAKAFAAQALDPVAVDRIAQLSGHHDAKARRSARRSMSRDQEREMTGADAPARPLRPRELVVPAKPAVGAEGERRSRQPIYFL